jgi:hypothetical protein
MTGADQQETRSEEFQLTVLADDVLDADAKLWAKLERYLGQDPVEAWSLAELDHREDVDPETLRPTGKIVSSASFRRDPTHPTPIVIRAQTETPAGEEAR